MRTIKNIILIIFCSIIAIPTIAQQNNGTNTGNYSGRIEHSGDSLYIHINVGLANLSLDRDRSVTLTPILSGNSRQRELPAMLVNGTTRQKVYDRSVALSGEAPSYYSVVKFDKNRRPLHYMKSLPYEAWMDSVSLDIVEDFCGCGGHQQETNINKVAYYKNEPVIPFVPQLAYIQPEVESVKKRADKWESFIDFPVNKANILADYMNNPAELLKINTFFHTISSDKNIEVTKIEVTGYASPEGSIAHNEKLSKERAENFKYYLQAKTSFTSNIYEVKYGGENWKGLEEALPQSNIKEKNQILEMIKNTSDINSLKNKIKALDKGVPYKQMLTEIYPKLRKVESTVQYNVRAFNLDEAKEILKTRPQQLSLDEMFRIANTYEAGSSDFLDVFEIAVRMFPEDKTANLNAAAAALSVKDVAKAQRYLDKSDKSTSEYLNNLGVLNYLQNNKEQAKSLFGTAAQKGLSSASYNMNNIK